MTNSFPATTRPQETTVYDVNGNEVGTVAEIFGIDTSESTAPTAQTGRPDSE